MERDDPQAELGGGLGSHRESDGGKTPGAVDDRVIGVRIAAGLSLRPLAGGPTADERPPAQRTPEQIAGDEAWGAEQAARLRAAYERMRNSDDEKGVGDTPVS